MNTSGDEIRGVEITVNSFVRGGDIDEERLGTDQDITKLERLNMKM